MRTEAAYSGRRENFAAVVIDAQGSRRREALGLGGHGVETAEGCTKPEVFEGGILAGRLLSEFAEGSDRSPPSDVEHGQTLDALEVVRIAGVHRHVVGQSGGRDQRIVCASLGLSP